MAKAVTAGSKEKRSTSIDDLTQAYNERGSSLRAIASRAGPHDVSDVIHDAFAKTIEACKDAQLEAPIHFLFRVTRNTVIDRLRSSARWSVIVQPRTNEADAPDGAAGPERALIASERLARALAVIDGMPERRRQVFALHRFEELTYVQIARKLGIGCKAVEKHMTAALIQLSREVDGD
jgi:RNA polymerase sigma-70 factor (ECF subfamily)